MSYEGYHSFGDPSARAQWTGRHEDQGPREEGKRKPREPHGSSRGPRLGVGPRYEGKRNRYEKGLASDWAQRESSTRDSVGGERDRDRERRPPSRTYYRRHDMLDEGAHCLDANRISDGNLKQLQDIAEMLNDKGSCSKGNPVKDRRGGEKRRDDAPGECFAESRLLDFRRNSNPRRGQGDDHETFKYSDRDLSPVSMSIGLTEDYFQEPHINYEFEVKTMSNSHPSYSVKSDHEEDVFPSSFPSYPFAQRQRRGRSIPPEFTCYQDNQYHHQKPPNLSPVSSTSLASVGCVDPEVPAPGRVQYYPSSNDIDLRCSVDAKSLPVSSSSHPDEVSCRFRGIGCTIKTKLTLISRHEEGCQYNPKNVRTECGACNLLVAPEHDCLQELKEELREQRKRTYSSTICNLLAATQGGIKFVWVHLVKDREEQIIRLKVPATGDVRGILIQAVNELKGSSRQSSPGEEYQPNETGKESDSVSRYQLIASGSSQLVTGMNFASLGLHLPSEPHLILMLKSIDVKVRVRKLVYEHDHVIVAVPVDVPLQVDPSATVHVLKQLIASKLPVNWSRHQLFHRESELKDYQVLFMVGIMNNDRVDVAADV